MPQILVETARRVNRRRRFRARRQGHATPAADNVRRADAPDDRAAQVTAIACASLARGLDDGGPCVDNPTPAPTLSTIIPRSAR